MLYQTHEVLTQCVWYTRGCEVGIRSAQESANTGRTPVNNPSQKGVRTVFSAD